MPLALILAFKLNMNVRGFWFGFSVALFVKETIVAAIIVCTDWDDVIEKETRANPKGNSKINEVDDVDDNYEQKV